MSPVVFLVTSALLGFMVVAAGAYALLYGAARFRKSRVLLVAAGLAYAMLALDAAGIVLATPLASPWKLLIAASAFAYFAIPPVTWRYLQYTHREEGAQL
jgi:uncharacterized membrane protein YgdD (TMEM256/DUF423 family)